MNTRAIDFTPSFAFGLILGIVALFIGLSFLWSIYQNFTEETKNSFDELKEKIVSLRDGKDSFMTYTMEGTGEKSKTVIGFDKGQELFEIQLRTSLGTTRDPETGERLSVPSKSLTFTYSLPSQCKKESACLCSCVKECTQDVSCISLSDIEKIEGSTYLKEFNNWETIRSTDEHTFVLPPGPKGTKLFFRIVRDGKTIYINPS